MSRRRVNTFHEMIAAEVEHVDPGNVQSWSFSMVRWIDEASVLRAEFLLPERKLVTPFVEALADGSAGEDVPFDVMGDNWIVFVATNPETKCQLIMIMFDPFYPGLDSRIMMCVKPTRWIESRGTVFWLANEYE